VCRATLFEQIDKYAEAHGYTQSRLLAQTATLFARETAGAARTRLSLRPLFEEGGKKQQTSGRFAPREREGAFEIARPFEN
jgi:hypothetical protein